MADPIQQIIDVLQSASHDYASMGWSTRCVDEALYLARSLQQGEGWMPIETAPEKGFVLVAAEFDRPGDWRIKMGYRDTGPDSLHGWRIFGASWKPTHWRHLPPPPTKEGERA